MAFVANGDGARAWEIATMINPVNHARTPQPSRLFTTEPYVMAADVYSIASHTGAAAGRGTPGPPGAYITCSWNPCSVATRRRHAAHCTLHAG
ncbi:MAG TPA: hypothetical protein VGL52_08755 [Casimicrobiaceae bacterium]